MPGCLSCLSTWAPRRNGERAPGAGDLAWELHQQAGAVLRAVSCDVEETETRCDRKSDCDGTAEAGLTPTFWCREADPYFHRGKPLLYSTTTGGSAVRARIKSLLSSFMPW